MKFCPNCASKILGEPKFCSNCAASLSVPGDNLPIDKVREGVLVDLFALKIGLQSIVKEMQKTEAEIADLERKRRNKRITLENKKSKTNDTINSISILRSIKGYDAIYAKEKNNISFKHSYEVRREMLNKLREKNEEKFREYDLLHQLEMEQKPQKSELELFEDDCRTEQENDKLKFKSIAEDYFKLTADYAALIHESDFQNLDYLIYLFVTNRCDNIKEALHLLDEEKRTQRIMKSIETSSQYIVNNIGSIMQEIGGQILRSIENSGLRISNTIVASHIAQMQSNIMASYKIAKAISGVSLTQYLTIKSSK